MGQNGSKNPAFEANTGVLGSEAGVCKYSEITENSEFVLFQIFQKLRKNDVKIEFWKSQKTRSYSNSDSDIRVQVQNAGP